MKQSLIPTSGVLKFYNYITSNSFNLIFFMSFLCIIRNILISGLTGTGDISNEFISNMGFEEQIIIAVIIGPALETIIFHFLLLELLLYVFKNWNYRYLFAVIISAVIFSLTHNWEVHYLIFSLIGGLIFSTSYIIAKVKNMIPVVVVFSIHAISNLMSTLVNNFT
jgi:uncharacterized protein